MSELVKSTLYLLDELRRLNDELYCKNAENAELVRKNAELLQVLSQRDAELAQNAIVLNDVKQELLSAKQELAQRNAELAQERICIRDRTVPAPIDIQVKLGEMFKTWEDAISSNGSAGFESCLSLSRLVTELHPKIRAATEQIKEPIIGLFYVTYNYTTTEYWPHARARYMNGYAELFTAKDRYYLSNYNSPRPPRFSGIPLHDHMVVIEDIILLDPRWKSYYTFVDPKWVKMTAISKNADFNKIIQYINQYSGHTGSDFVTDRSTHVIGTEAIMRCHRLHAIWDGFYEK